MKNKSEYKIKNTLGMFDLIKGMAMILIMLFHTAGILDTPAGSTTSEELIEELGIPLASLRVIFIIAAEVMMPLLFIINGYGYRKTNLEKYIKKQARTLLVPFGITAIVTTVLNLVVIYLTHLGWLRYSIVETLKLFAGFVLGLPAPVTIAGGEIPSCGPVWFLMALFVGDVIFDWILLHFDNDRVLLVSFIVSCVGWLIGLLGISPFCISQGCVAVLYICMGYLAKKKSLFVSSFSVKKIAVMVVTFILAFIITCIKDFSMWASQYFWGPVSIVVFGVLSLLIINMFLYLNRCDGIISNGVRRVGRVSLYVLCVHTAEKLTFGGVAQYKFLDIWTGSIFVRSMILFGARLVVVLLGTMFVLRVKASLYDKRKSTMKGYYD